MGCGSISFMLYTSRKWISLDSRSQPARNWIRFSTFVENRNPRLKLPLSTWLTTFGTRWAPNAVQFSWPFMYKIMSGRMVDKIDKIICFLRGKYFLRQGSWFFSHWSYRISFVQRYRSMRFQINLFHPKAKPHRYCGPGGAKKYATWISNMKKKGKKNEGPKWIEQ